MFGLTPFNRGGLQRRNRDLVGFYDLMDDFFKDSLLPAANLRAENFKMDVKETEKEYIVEAEMPGIKKEEIEISYREEMLTISVKKEEEKKEEKENYLHQERSTSSMMRSMYMKNIDSENIKAKLSEGVLMVTIPKKTAAEEKRQITVD